MRRFYDLPRECTADVYLVGGARGEGFPQKGVNKTTQILVVGQQDYKRVGEDGMSSKQEKAMALKDAGQDIEIISEEQFLCMLGVELQN